MLNGRQWVSATFNTKYSVLNPYLGGLVTEDLVEVEGLGDVREGLLLDGDLTRPRAGDDGRGTGLTLIMVQRPKNTRGKQEKI